MARSVTARLLDHARIPVRYRDAEIAQIPEIAAFAKEVRANIKSGCGLLLIGPPDTGKTASVSAICKLALAHTAKVLYISAPDLVAALDQHARFYEDMPMEEAFRDRDLLVIDDLGTEIHESPISKQVIVNLIRHRVNEVKATIVVTAFSKEQLTREYGSGLIPILQRACTFVDMSGQSAKRRVEEATQAGSTRAKPYSSTDQTVFKLIGKENFSVHSNDELRKAYLRRAAEIGIDLKGEAGRSRLNRIRRRHNLPSSKTVKRKTVSSDRD